MRVSAPCGSIGKMKKATFRIFSGHMCLAERFSELLLYYELLLSELIWFI